MQETSIIVAGFGGQGVLFAGQLLAYTGMDNGLNVTWIPSYGPEMRGGTANCTVIISSEEIGAPLVAQPDIAIVLNQPSFEKYEPMVKPGGLMIVNSSIVTLESDREDIEIARIPANDIAAELGSAKMLNMAALGAMLAKRPLFDLDTLFTSLTDHLPARKTHLLDANYKVMQKGFEMAQAAAVPA